MTLYELTKMIEKFATLEHVNSTFVGDIYDLNHLQCIKYPAFVVTQGTHTPSFNDETLGINYSLFFVDRLLEDKSNELEVQSWAIEAVNNLVNNITENKLGYIDGTASVNTFTERFDSLCAGAFANINLKIAINSCDEPIKLVTSVNGMTGNVVIPTVDNLKTINGESIIGEGNIEINAGVTSVNGKKGDVELTGKDVKIESAFIGKDNIEDAIISIQAELEGTTDTAIYLSLEKIPEIENNIKNIKADQETISEEIDDILYTNLPAKQDKLVSGTNVKTINGESILGEGDIEISGGTVDVSSSTIKGISSTTELSLAFDADGKLAIVKYSPIVVSNVAGGGTYELGSTRTSITITWTVSGSNPVEQKVDGTVVNNSDRSKTITGSWSSAKTFTVTAKDAKGNSSSGSTSIGFALRKYYGVSDKDTLTNDDVLALNNKPLGGNKTLAETTFNCSGGKYPWYCIPTSYGEPSFIVGGLPNSDFVKQELEITNASGHKDSYQLWRTKYIQTGEAVKIQVK